TSSGGRLHGVHADVSVPQWMQLIYCVVRCPLWWPPMWGPRPADVREVVRVAREQFRQVPRLIPVWGDLHYLPAEPEQTGNPVLSFLWMTDSVYWARDLRDYLSREGTPQRRQRPPMSEFRPIRFWNDVIQTWWGTPQCGEAFRWMSAQEWD